MKAQNTEKKAHPYWTAASGIASSFIPFGLGAFITPAANMGVQKGKQVGTDRLADYEAQLGITPRDNAVSSGLDLGGFGYSLGKGIQNATGMDTATQIEGLATQPKQNVQGNPTAPQQMDGQQSLNLPQSEYWNNQGGGVSGLFSVTDDGYTKAPPTSTSTLQRGGRIEGASHEEGGVGVYKDGQYTGIDVEGTERVVNKNDWSALMKFLEKGKNKNALLLLKDIDKRKPQEENDGGANLEFGAESTENMLTPQVIGEDPQLDYSGFYDQQSQLPFSFNGISHPRTDQTIQEVVNSTPTQQTVTDTVTDTTIPAQKKAIRLREYVRTGH